MAWQDFLKDDPLPWLLELESPGVRYLTLRDILEVSPESETLLEARQAAYIAGPIASILAEMDAAGYWVKPGPGYNPKYRATVWSLVLLAQLGATAAQDPRIAQACAYLLEHALTSGGQFSISGVPSGTVDCLQGNLCAALLAVGYNDPRLDAAYEWMARSVTGEGVAPREERQAAVRYYAGKCGSLFACGANNQLPCAWGAVKVMLAFSRLPLERRTPLIRRAIQCGIDFLLGTDPAGAKYPSGWADKPSGNWWKFGFPVFYVTDILQIAEALVGLGYGDDPRLAGALKIILEKQNSQGRWALEYNYTGKTWVDFGTKKQPNKWVTLRAVRLLRDLDNGLFPA